MLASSLLGRLAVDAPVVDRAQCGTWWRFRDVSNPYSRLYLVTAGEARVRHHGRWYALRRNALHLIPAFTRADLYCPEAFEVCFLHFTCRLAGGLDLFSLLECDYQVRARRRDVRRFERLLALNPGARLKDYDPYKPPDEVEPCPPAAGDARALAARVETDALVRLLLVPFLETARNLPGSRLGEIRRFEPVLDWIEGCLDRPIRLAEMAAQAHLHPTYFSDRFARAVAMRPMAYVHRRRVERAQTLLRATGRSVKQVAFETGFRSVPHFCRLFRRLCGATPEGYRRQATGEPG